MKILEEKCFTQKLSIYLRKIKFQNEKYRIIIKNKKQIIFPSQYHKRHVPPFFFK